MAQLGAAERPDRERGGEGEQREIPNSKRKHNERHAYRGIHKDAFTSADNTRGGDFSHEDPEGKPLPLRRKIRRRN